MKAGWRMQRVERSRHLGSQAVRYGDCRQVKPFAVVVLPCAKVRFF
jgi:hypothetical protein